MSTIFTVYAYQRFPVRRFDDSQSHAGPPETERVREEIDTPTRFF